MNSACSAARNQVTVLGINSLFGKVVSFLLKQSPVANRLVLYDEVDIKVAHDIAEIPTPCKVVAYNGEEQLRCAVKNSDVILIGDKEDFLASEDVAISRKAADIIKYANAISSMAPNAIVLIAATPVNSLLPLFTEAQICSGSFDGDKVMGVTSADTMRASTLLARHMRIEPEKAYLPVIGGSSADTRIPLFSQSRPNADASKDDLKNLTRVVKLTENELTKMLNRGEALNKAYATVQLIDSVMSALRGQRNISEIVLSRTCLVPNVDYFSLPVILGRRGIAHRFPLPSLTETESILLEHAVKHIEIDKMKGISALSGKCSVPQEPDVSEKYCELITEGCQKDLVGSLIKKFKLGACHEVYEPRVEYKLLSKVKFKLPPEPTPSEIPKRTKFVEPDTPPQDGCCPLKLPCPPIPPIRGLNQIQAKHTCKIKGKPKASKSFFPPVEKSIIPCMLRPSNKPCTDYANHNKFYEENSHWGGPIYSAVEDSACSNIAAISVDDNTTHNSIAPHHYSVQPVPAVNPNGLGASELSTGLVENVGATAQVKPVDVKAVWDYSSTDRVSDPECRPIPAVAQQQQHSSSNIISPQGKEPSLQVRTNIPNPQPFLSEQKNFGPRSTSGTDCQTSSESISNLQTSSTTNPATPQTSIQSGIIQHEEPSRPFKCSTSLCLDILAPRQNDDQFLQDKSVVPGDLVCNPSAPKQTALQNASASPQNPKSVRPAAKNTTTSNQHEQHKKQYYSSGLCLNNPQETVEKIGVGKGPQGREGLQSGHQEAPNHTPPEQGSIGILEYQPNSCLFPTQPNDEGNTELGMVPSNLKESKNLAPLSPQKSTDRDINTESSNRHGNTNTQEPYSTKSIGPSTNTNNKQEQHAEYNYRSGISLTNPPEVMGRSRAGGHSITIKPPGISEKDKECRGRSNYKTLDDSSTWDENVRRRMNATLKLIDDIKSEPKQSTTTNRNAIGLSLSQYLIDGPENSMNSRRIPETGEVGSSGNSMLSILRERAQSINANMELQRDLRASLDRSKQNRCKDTLRLGDLVDTINPAKRLIRRLESRPALRKSYQGLRQFYQDPKNLENRGKIASILITPTPCHEESPMVTVEDAKENRKLSSRVEQIKERIQEALKKIIYPTPSESKPVVMPSVQQRLNYKLVTQPAMRKSTKAKQDFFVQLRKTDPAYRPTTRLYAAKCPTRLLYDDHPKNHAHMITFNNVIDNETEKASSLFQTQKGTIKDKTAMRNVQDNSKGYNLPDLPNFPELILEEMAPKTIRKDVLKSNVSYSKGSRTAGDVETKWLPLDDYGNNELRSQDGNSQETRCPGPVRIQGDNIKHIDAKLLPKAEIGSKAVHSPNYNPQERRYSEPVRSQGDYAKHSEARLLPKDGECSNKEHSQDQNPQKAKSSRPVHIQGDYVKHFDTKLLPRDLNLPEWIKAAIRERRRNFATPKPKAPRFNDMRYRMTSPNRLTYPRKRE